MRYRENREQTAELLRMVLPLMSRHAAGFHPLSYAVWYEYAAGTNQGLKAAVDGRVAAGTRLTDQDIEELFDRHVAMRDIESSMIVRARIQEVVEQVTEATSHASQEVGRYGVGLSGYQQRLQRELEKEAIADIVQGLLGDTDRLRERTDDFRQHLEANSREARRLQGELEAAQGQAQVDPLTGLLNARGFEYRVNDLYPTGLPGGALLRLGIDQFASFGEKFGHLLADRVLATVAQILSTAVAQGTLIARAGGEVYLVLLVGGQPAALLQQAERIRGGVERCRIRRQDAEATAATVTASIGVIVLSGGEALAAMLARSEQALASARLDGGNRITVGAA
jgi:diguanylate cyclase